VPECSDTGTGDGEMSEIAADANAFAKGAKGSAIRSSLFGSTRNCSSATFSPTRGVYPKEEDDRRWISRPELNVVTDLDQHRILFAAHRQNGFIAFKPSQE
jgi:hypothetical protein